nr:hypothetical protein [uncultured Methanospirillum sp.]
MIRIDSSSPVRVEGVARGSIIRSNEIDTSYYRQLSVRHGEKWNLCIRSARYNL